VNEYRCEVCLSVVAGPGAGVAAIGEKREGGEAATGGAGACADALLAAEPNRKPADGAGAATAGTAGGANAGRGGVLVGSGVDAAASEGRRSAAGAVFEAASLFPKKPTGGATPKLKTGVVGAAARLVVAGLVLALNPREAELPAAPKMLGPGLLVGGGGGGGGGLV
jgi:hypothetical protein